MAPSMLGVPRSRVWRGTARMDAAAAGRQPASGRATPGPPAGHLGAWTVLQALAAGQVTALVCRPEALALTVRGHEVRRAAGLRHARASALLRLPGSGRQGPKP